MVKETLELSATLDELVGVFNAMNVGESADGLHADTRAHLAKLAASGPDAPLESSRKGKTTARAIFLIATGKLGTALGKMEERTVRTVAGNFLRRRWDRITRPGAVR